MLYFCLVSRGCESVASSEICELLAPTVLPICTVVQDACSGAQCHPNSGRSCLYFETDANPLAVAALRSVECVCAWVFSASVLADEIGDMFTSAMKLQPRSGTSASAVVRDAHTSFRSDLDGHRLRSSRKLSTGAAAPGESFTEYQLRLATDDNNLRYLHHSVLGCIHSRKPGIPDPHQPSTVPSIDYTTRDPELVSAPAPQMALASADHDRMRSLHGAANPLSWLLPDTSTEGSASVHSAAAGTTQGSLDGASGASAHSLPAHSPAGMPWTVSTPTWKYALDAWWSVNGAEVCAPVAIERHHGAVGKLHADARASAAGGDGTAIEDTQRVRVRFRATPIKCTTRRGMGGRSGAGAMKLNRKSGRKATSTSYAHATERALSSLLASRDTSVPRDAAAQTGKRTRPQVSPGGRMDGSESGPEPSSKRRPLVEHDQDSRNKSRSNADTSMPDAIRPTSKSLSNASSSSHAQEDRDRAHSQFPSDTTSESARGLRERGSMHIDLKSPEIGRQAGELTVAAFQALITNRRVSRSSTGSMDPVAGGVHPLECPVDRIDFTVSLVDFDLEVIIVTDGLRVEAGISLARGSCLEAQHRHHLITQPRPGLSTARTWHLPKSKVGLRGNISYALLRLACPRAGDVVLDSMCGAGYLAAEAFRVGATKATSDRVTLKCHSGMRDFVVIGGELALGVLYGGEESMHETSGAGKEGASVSDTQAAVAAELVKANPVGDSDPYPFDRCAWDAMRLPLRPGMIDVAVVDLPFGRRCGSKHPLNQVYARVAHRLADVLREPEAAGPTAGRAVLLCSNGPALASALLVEPRLEVLRARPMDNGGIGCLAVVLRRIIPDTAAKFAASHEERVRAVFATVGKSKRRVPRPVGSTMADATD